jgi:hypothetical protein
LADDASRGFGILNEPKTRNRRAAVDAPAVSAAVETLERAVYGSDFRCVAVDLGHGDVARDVVSRELARIGHVTASFRGALFRARSNLESKRRSTP